MLKCCLQRQWRCVVSDNDYLVNEYERTIEELRFQVRWLKTMKDTLEHQVDTSREDADKARLEATRWKMLYEQERQRHE